MSNNFNIYVPSYNRAKTTTTYKLLPFCTYVVRKSQEKEYKENGIENIWAIDDELIDSALKVYSYVIENSEEDVIALCDDDITSFVFRLINIEHVEDKEKIYDEILGLAQAIVDLKIGYLTTDSACEPFYQTPLSFVSGVSGAFKIINKKYYKVKVDSNIKYCQDIDAILQQLITNRVVLHPNYFLANAKIDKNSGGISTDRIRKEVLDSVTAMENKCGKYFSYNFKRNIPRVNVKR